MFCEKCGTPLEIEYRFCPNCNTPVPVDGSSPQTILGAKQIFSEQSNTKKKKSKKKTTIIIVCISILVLIGMLFGLVLFSDELNELGDVSFDSVTTEAETEAATESEPKNEIYAKDYLGMNNKLILEKLGDTYTFGRYYGGGAARSYVLDNIPQLTFVYSPDDWSMLEVDKEKVILFIALNQGGKVDSHFNREMTYNELRSEISKVGTDVTFAEGTGGDPCEGPELLYYLNIFTADYYIHYQWNNVIAPTENAADEVIVYAPNREEFYGEVNFSDEFCGNWNDSNRLYMDIYYDGENYRIHYYGNYVDSGFGNVSDEIIGTYDETGDAIYFEKYKKTTETFDFEGNNPDPIVVTEDVDNKGYLQFNTEGLMMYFYSEESSSYVEDRVFYKEY